MLLLLLGAPPAGAPLDPDPAGLSESPGAPAAPRGAQPHPQDGAGVREARWAGATAAGGAGEKGQKLQELGVCCVYCQHEKNEGLTVSNSYNRNIRPETCL